MTWGFFNHNNFPRDVDQVSLPIVGSTTDGLLWWSNDTTESVSSQHGHCGNPYGSYAGYLADNNSFAMGPGNKKAMMLRAYGGGIDFTDDYGATWQWRSVVFGLTPKDDSYQGSSVVRDIMYRESDDTWFVLFMHDIVQLSAQKRWGYVYYSRDDGLTWSLVDTNQVHRRDNHCLHFNATDQLTVIGNPSSGNFFAAVYTAVPQEEPTVGADLLSNSGGSTFRENVRNGYIISNGGGKTWRFPSSMATAVDLGVFTPGLWTTGSGHGNPNGELLMVNLDTTLAALDPVIRYTIIGDTGVNPFPTGSITFANDLNGIFLGWVGNYYFAAAGQSADPSMIEVRISSTGLDGSWSDAYWWDLPFDKEPSPNSSSGNSLHENQFQIQYYGDGVYCVMAHNNTTNDLAAALFSFGQPVTIPSGYGPLRSAINSQSPDIFMLMDDLLGATTVEDLGRKGYTNSTYGTLTFEETGLVPDDGTAVTVAAADSGIVVDAVPAPNDHAHVFVFAHDATASFRILASSGDLSNPTSGHSYYIALATDHKITVATYINDSWVFDTSTAVIATATPTLVAVWLQEDTVKIYIETTRDSVHDISLQAIGSTKLSLGGGWDGTTLDDSATGVTIDYYALIPSSTFSYGPIATGWGITYVPPVGSDGAIAANVAFLMHADESALLGPFASSRVIGKSFYTLLNSVNGTINRISSEATTGRLVNTDKKFGAGSGAITARTAFPADWNPFDIIYWPITNATPQQRGLPDLILGTRDFTFDTWVKDLAGAPYHLLDNSWVTMQNGIYRGYGGITIQITPGSSSVSIRCRFHGPYSNPGRTSSLVFHSIPGYTPSGWNHIAIVRKNGLFYAFLNGTRGLNTSYDGANPTTLYIPEGSQVMLGAHVDGGPGGTSYRRIQSDILLDESRLVLDQGLFTDDFSPPTAPYDYD